MLPRTEADRFARKDKPTSKTARLRYYRIDEVDRLFSEFRDNFALEHLHVGLMPTIVPWLTATALPPNSDDALPDQAA